MVALAAQAVQVIIVGAGLSGLRAATDIQDAGLSYMVLEAMDHVGGKTLSVSSSTNSAGHVDLGAAWINNSTQSEMFALAQKYGFDLVEQRAEGDSVYEDAQGNFSTIPYGLPAALNPDQIEELQAIMVNLTGYVERSDLENPELGPDAAQLDALTALDFAEKMYGSDLAKSLVTTLTRALLGVDADDLSALFLVDYIKSGTGLDHIISDTKDGGQYLRNRQGNQMFSKNYAAALDQSSLKLSTAVAKITQSDSGCIVETKDGAVYRSEKVIVSAPTSLYPLIQFEPALPAAKQKLAQSTKLGFTSKTILVYDQPWWRAANLSGVFSSADGPVGFTRDTCVPEDEQYSLTCFHVGAPGRSWSRLSAEDRKNAVLEQIGSAFGAVVKDIPEPINVIEKDWLKDPWALGAPSPVMMPGLLTSDAGKSIRKPYGNIHFVGTETSIVWKGYMEGAVRSGARGASEVISELEAKGNGSHEN